MKQSQEQVNAVNHQPPRAPIYEEPYHEGDTCSVTDQIGGFWTNYRGPIRTVVTKVNEIKVRTSIEMVPSEITIEVATVIGIRAKTKMLIEDAKMVTGIVCMYHHTTMTLGMVVRGLR